MDESISHIAEASGPRSVSISSNANDILIITGDKNSISLNQDGTFHFHLMDEDFRDKMQNAAPAAFYDGIRANWANIANKDDADRALYTDVWNFVENHDLPTQRMGIILGLAGEGKTTLLMRLAWDLAEDGYTVFWRHSGLAFPTSKQDFRSSKVLSENPVIFAGLLDSCHSFIRAIRDKISTKRSRIMTNDANRTNVRTSAQPPQNQRVSLEFPIVPSSNPIVLCFDQADQESDLPMLAHNLSESGVPFIILCTSIYHEWHNANLETHLRRFMSLRPFNLTRLNECEVNSLLDRLAEANKLDALANLTRSSQVSHFMDKLTFRTCLCKKIYFFCKW